MKNRLVLIAALALLGTITGCAVRLSMEVKNPFHPDVYQQNSNRAPAQQK